MGLIMSEQNQQSVLLGKIAAYTGILVKDPGSTIFVSLAETYRKLGVYDDARQIIAKGIKSHPDFAPAYVVLGRVLCQLDNFDDSIEAFSRALELACDSLAALVGFARVQILLGNEVEARELLLKARQLSPADAIINKLLLSLPQMDGQVGEQEEKSGFDDDQGEVSELASPTLAALYQLQGLSEKALIVYQQLSDQDPDNLDLRRKIKELEGELQLNNNLDNGGDSIITPLIPSESGSIRIEDSVAVTDDDFAGETVLDTLNRWLNNIQLRRENV